ANRPGHAALSIRPFEWRYCRVLRIAYGVPVPIPAVVLPKVMAVGVLLGSSYFFLPARDIVLSVITLKIGKKIFHPTCRCGAYLSSAANFLCWSNARLDA